MSSASCPCKTSGCPESVDYKEQVLIAFRTNTNADPKKTLVLTCPRGHRNVYIYSDGTLK